MDLRRFVDLQDEVLYWLDEAGDAGTTRENVKNAINQAHAKRLTSMPWSFALWPRDETITCVLGQRTYTLNPAMGRLHTLYNQGTKKFLSEITPRGLSEVNILPTDTRRADYFRLTGVSSVALQPTSASVLTVVSSDVGDVGALYTVTVQGIADGVWREEEIVPNGTTSVAGTLSFSQVVGVVKSGTWAGTMTLTSNSGAVTVLSLTSSEYGRQYPTIELLALPEVADTIAYRFYRQPIRLVDDNAIPMIPAPHSQVLVWDTLLAFAGYNTDLAEKSIILWKGLQSEMTDDMQKAYLEGGTHAARGRYVRSSGDGDGVGPVIYR